MVRLSMNEVLYIIPPSVCKKSANVFPPNLDVLTYLTYPSLTQLHQRLRGSTLHTISKQYILKEKERVR